ncbi:MAG: LamG-like jellyroll fold domain-containing protein, partial [Planctomycetota bacterium]|nr:LamG-like jellyroll fold domain-containing protein [Planctomycetota bacterium]
SVRLAGWTALGEVGFTQYGVADYRFTPIAGFTLDDLIIKQGEWVHLTWRNDGAGTQFFLNGKLVGTSSDTIDLPRLRIGGRGGGPADHLMGVLDEAVVFNRALTDTDIVAHSAASALLDPSVLGASSPNPTDGAIHPDTWVSLGWSPGGTAVSHDVYFSDSFDDVDNRAGDAFRGNQPTTTFIAGFVGFPYPDGLIPGATYYWRVDEVDAETTHEGPVWSFLVPPKSAYNPAPADGGRFVNLDPTLSWTGGFGAKLHTVYFGDNLDDVNNAASGLPQSANTLTPAGPLAKDTVYYWRVDEFDAITTHKGDVWSFRTLPDIAITDPSLVGWWKFDEGQGSMALDWSGQNSHGVLSGNPQWVVGQDGGALKLDGNNWIDCGTPDVLQVAQEITIACWINPTALSGDRGFVALDGSYAFKASGDHLRFTTPGVLDHDAANAILSTGTWQHVAVTFQPDQTVAFYINGFEIERMVASAVNSGAGPFRIGNNQWNQTFTGMIDDVRVYNKVLTAEEITQAMRGDPLVAWDASPTNGSTPDIDNALPLAWQPGDNASQHDVYFGTDVDAVTDADASDTTGVYRGSQNGASFAPAEGVEWGGGPYYWRIDENNTDGTVTKGRVWTFTVADFILVDDFESYTDNDAENEAIWQIWIDGFGVPTNGSQVGYLLPPYAERTTVNSGAQSMPLSYDNTAGVTYSEAALKLTSPRDWTAHGVAELSLWFHGDPANGADQLYVAVASANGQPVIVNHPDAGAAQTNAWTEWVIPLQTLADQGVNLANVDEVIIGLGVRGNIPVAGGAGNMLIDDIRLYQPRDAAGQ